MNYQYLMDSSASQLGVFGPTEILRSYDTYQFNNYSRYLRSYDTYQFNNYSRYNAAQFDGHHKAEVRTTLPLSSTP